MSQHVISNVIHKSDLNDKKDNERLLKLEHELSIVKVELEAEKRRVQDKQETIDSLKTALKLLEYRQDKSVTIEPPKEDTASEPQKNGSSVDNSSNTGLLGRLKKLFS
ncbi:hypothetical protein [Commensalibacter papalotli (ex Servin-Garciduenas et al. 2014)]|nr:hypothetical protein [Commensalibacter papalotli (ex Servin-Garciduenas et al. 2014)]